MEAKSMGCRGEQKGKNARRTGFLKEFAGENKFTPKFLKTIGLPYVKKYF
jgi:hypothetical protein